MLRQAGHEVDTVPDESLSDAADDAVLAAARAADGALVTLDLAFADPLRFPPAATAGIVVLRPTRIPCVAASTPARPTRRRPRDERRDRPPVGLNPRAHDRRCPKDNAVVLTN
ncbi:MAG: DUF5615 family PIN-like protein [Acidimicrobiales bacterium]